MAEQRQRLLGRHLALTEQERQLLADPRVDLAVRALDVVAVRRVRVGVAHLRLDIGEAPPELRAHRHVGAPEGVGRDPRRQRRLAATAAAFVSQPYGGSDDAPVDVLARVRRAGARREGQVVRRDLPERGAIDEQVLPQEGRHVDLAHAGGRLRVADNDPPVGEIEVAPAQRGRLRAAQHIDIGGPTLAASLYDLIDEFRMWVSPVLAGGGKPFFPAQVDVQALRRLEARSMSAGVLYLRYERASCST